MTTVGALFGTSLRYLLLMPTLCHLNRDSNQRCLNCGSMKSLLSLIKCMTGLMSGCNDMVFVDNVYALVVDEQDY